MPKLGDRVIYRAHDDHLTVVEEHVHEEVGGKKVPQFDTVEEHVHLEDGDRKIPQFREVDGKKVPLTRAKKVPVMRVVSHGSIHHPELRKFVGIIGAVRTEPATAERRSRTVYDIYLIVPNREARWVDGVVEGTGPHEFTVREDTQDRALKSA